MSERFELTVVVPAYRRVEALARVLAGLGAQDCPRRRFEVVVVVDGGDSQVCGLLGKNDYTKSDTSADVGRLRYVVIPEGGPAVSRNRGAALARAPVLLFLDDDVIPCPALVREHLALHQRDPGAVGLGRIDLDGARALTPFERYLYRFYDVHYLKMDSAGYRPTFWDALTGNLSVPAGAFWTLGGFDESFSLMRHEDVELGYRLRQAGLRFCYLPAAVGYHQYVKVFKRGCHEAYVNGVSSVMLAERYEELRGELIGRRWASLPQPARMIAPLLLRLGREHLTAWLEALRPVAERTPGIAWLFPRAAYHLSFWRGVKDAQDGHLRREAVGG
jgi:GT2 family glycosyltransferase